jgi:hypothetical protein
MSVMKLKKCSVISYIKYHLCVSSEVTFPAPAYIVKKSIKDACKRLTQCKTKFGENTCGVLNRKFE